MKTDFYHKLWRLVFFVFLAFVCTGQVYQSVHVHHFHNDRSIAFKVSTHPPYVDIDHTTSHHHHEENSSHEDENEHKYKKLAVWRNASRAKVSLDIAYDYSGLPALTGFLPVVGFEVPKFSPAILPHPKEYNRPSGVIRGPPSHV